MIKKDGDVTPATPSAYVTRGFSWRYAASRVTLPGIHKPEHDGNDEWEYLLIIQSPAPFALANDMPNTLMVFNDVFVRGLFATIGTLTGDSKPP